MRAGTPTGRRALLAAAVLGLAGCASTDPFAHAPMREHLARPDAVGECARLLQTLDRQVLAAGARDAQEAIVPGFPYLRVDRLGEALAARAVDDVPWRLWRGRLADPDRRARMHELRNAASPGGPAISEAPLEACRDVLIEADDDGAARGRLRELARVPDDYSSAMRTLGLYPLTQLAFAAGIRDWHARTRAVFALPLDALPVEGRLRTYVPAPDVARAIVAPGAAGGSTPVPGATIGRDALGVPRIASLAGLLQRHAPVIEVDDTGTHDRIGALAFKHASAVARVDLAAPPVAYVRLGFGWLGGLLRPQLVYTVWFPERPKAHALDLLGGQLDALVWRVTLDDDGAAMVYDAIHACGCYHQFFATPRVSARAAPPPGQGPNDEGLFMPQPPLPQPAAGERVVLRLATRTHHLQRVRWLGSTRPGGATADRLPYRLLDEDGLRSLPVPADGTAGGGWRSAYDESGLVPGSERLERFLFWPMGIASAGQMRQWGRHATAFVGRRHFDDPWLLDRYFDAAARPPRPWDVTAER
jgi:hypothetical protein